MSKITPHFGRIKSTDSRCVVIYPEVPGSDETCLIVMPDALPDMLRDIFFNALHDDGASKAYRLADFLATRPGPSGKDILNELHATRQIHKQLISNVILTPTNTSKMELSTFISRHKRQSGNDSERSIEDLSFEAKEHEDRAKELRDIIAERIAVNAEVEQLNAAHKAREKEVEVFNEEPTKKVAPKKTTRKTTKAHKGHSTTAKK